MPAGVPGTSRSLRTHSDALRKQPDNAYSPSTLAPAAKPAPTVASVTNDNTVAAPGHQSPTSSAQGVGPGAPATCALFPLRSF
ncbi:hypothetical protein SprV_0301140100 [Sparganum proliferum]